MRILSIGNMYPPHHLGGYELTWRAAVEHLRSSGHRVRVLTTDYRNPTPDPAFPEDPDIGRRLRWYWRDGEFPSLSPRQTIALERHNHWVLERELREVRPDVVNWWAMGGMSLSLIERVGRAGLPAVGVVGDEWMLYGHKVDAWTRLARRLGPLGPMLGALVGVPARLDLSPVLWLFNSDYTLNRSLSTGRRLEWTDVVNPGVDTRLFRPAPEHDWDWRLLYVGRVEERKGIDTALRTLAELPSQARLTALGSGDERHLAQLRELSRELGIDARVDWGWRPRHELPAAYAEADALLFPVRWEEPWGLVPLESMAVGTPVVATGTGGSAEYLRHDDNALVVGRQAGPPELAAAVRRLAEQPELRHRLRQAGLRTSEWYTEESYNQAVAAALELVAALPEAHRPPVGAARRLQTLPGVRRALWERDRLRERADQGLRSAVRRAARITGLDVVPAGVYSPIPEVPPPGDEAWRRQYPFEVDTAAQLTFLEEELDPYITEVRHGVLPARRYGFRLWNGQYQAGDAETLYAVVRHARPQRVLELGSGYSTLVTASACAANAAAGHPVEFVAVDPRPQIDLPDRMEGLTRLERRDARCLPLERFWELGEDDVLFIDTSHVVKLGSEVNLMMLEVLPRLRPGVWVHLHDIFLPWEYSRYLLELESYFTEQYLVQAFLAGNRGWEVKLSLCALFRRERERLVASIPSLREEHRARHPWVTPSSFWLRRLGSD